MIEKDGEKYRLDGEFFTAADGSHVLYRGIKYVWIKRYYKRMRNFSKKDPCNLHRRVWMDHFGEIPENCHIHHVDGNTKNNNITNLQCLPAFIHLSRAAKTNRWLKSVENKAHLASIRDKCSAWHKSEEGKGWHSRAMKNSWVKRKKTSVKCVECGKEYEASFPSRAKYCHQNCRENARKKSGIENENRVCVVCKKYFVINKYCRTKTCCRSCSDSMKQENARLLRNKTLEHIHTML